MADTPAGESGAITQVGARGGWSLSGRDDLMTDGHVSVLTTAIAGQTIDVELEVSCDPTARRFRYVIGGFDKRGQPAPMTVHFQDGARHRFTYRADGGRPDTMSPPVRYDNQIEEQTAATFLTNARRLVLRIPFRNSDETYVVDQSGPTFRNTIARCQHVIDAADQTQGDQAAAAAQRQQQLDAQPITVAPAPPSDGRPGHQAPAAQDGWNSIAPQ